MVCEAERVGEVHAWVHRMKISELSVTFPVPGTSTNGGLGYETHMPRGGLFRKGSA